MTTRDHTDSEGPPSRTKAGIAKAKRRPRKHSSARSRRRPSRAELKKAVGQLQAQLADLHAQLYAARAQAKNPAEMTQSDSPPFSDGRTKGRPIPDAEVCTIPVRYQEQPHGGMLKEGGTRGPGRPKNVFRDMLRGDLEQRRQFLLDVIDGKEFIQPGMFGPILAPAPIVQRVKAWGELAKYALGPAGPRESSEKRQLAIVMRRE